MNRGNNYTVQQVLQGLQTDQLDDSGDENEETELQDKEFVSNCCAGVESCDNDTDSGEDEQSSAAVSIDFLSESDQSVSQNTAGQVNARNGTVWKTTGAPGLGRASSSKVFAERPGPTSYCHRSVVNGSPYSAFHLFIDEHILKCIQKHTIDHGKKDNDDFDLHVDELESFIGLQIARGVLVGKNTPVRQL